MNKIYKILFILLAAFAVSCNKDDNNGTPPLRDYAEQYAKDIDTIDEFIDTHYMTVSPEFDVTFTHLSPTDTEHESIREQQQYPLLFKTVAKHDIEYKLYYIKFREGENNRPTKTDSIHVSYKGNLISLSQFDYAQTPIWFPLDNVVSGWQEVMPLFKTGSYDATEGPDPVTFTGYGAGVMFLPSGLAYYQQGRNGIPSYSSLIFSFKLYELRYRDQDQDGIRSKDEVLNAGDEPFDYDSDGDGTPNMYDVDDDGDHMLTKFETGRPLTAGQTEDDRTYYPFNGAAVDDPLTPIDETQGIPSCSGDFTTPARLRKHLDPTCQQAADTN
jgi:FKBP-type peptidyl-prolyl cis-trans isomerase FkpA